MDDRYARSVPRIDHIALTNLSVAVKSYIVDQKVRGVTIIVQHRNRIKMMF